MKKTFAILIIVYFFIGCDPGNNDNSDDEKNPRIGTWYHQEITGGVTKVALFEFNEDKSGIGTGTENGVVTSTSTFTWTDTSISYSSGNSFDLSYETSTDTIIQDQSLGINGVIDTTGYILIRQ